MQISKNKPSDWQLKNNSSSKKLILWSFIWVLSIALLNFGPKHFWDFNTYFSLLAIGINLATGTAMLIAHKNVLINQDELQQKIALEAMALSLGVGAVLGMCYEAFEDMQLIQYEPEIPHLVMVMCVTYMAGHLRGHWKYR